MAKAASIGDNIEQVVLKATRQRIERIAWRSIYQPSVRMVNRYRVGRVFLAGRRSPRPSTIGRTGPQHRCTGRVQPRMEARARRQRRTVIAPRHLRIRASSHRRRSPRPKQASASNTVHQARRRNQPARPPLPHQPPLLGRSTWHTAPRRSHCLTAASATAGSSNGCAALRATELQLIDGPRILIRPPTATSLPSATTNRPNMPACPFNTSAAQRSPVSTKRGGPFAPTPSRPLTSG